ncbi:aminoacyl-histidine dipeptidase [candidate division KSB1 bacterium]|nr:aminoacyl-histidine dipeptidase [candidate division KSB1 bacterium]
MHPLLEKLEPQLLWKHFDEIRKIPHGSKNETAIAQYVISVAKQNKADYSQDAVGNIVIRKSATPGHEKAPIMILQSHLDMVCEKNSDVEFDFMKDAIQLAVKDGWLTAVGTTLGADNGIGVAASLAILEAKNLTHGSLELLFTIDEETGLTGAGYIKSDFLKGRKYLNLDSEEEGVFTIGCSGGADTTITLPISREKAPAGAQLQIKIAGLKGGHSGIDINAGRGNAIKILNRVLWDLDREISMALLSLQGGNKRNAIPREAVAEMIVPAAKTEAARLVLDKSFEELKFEFRTIEKDLRLEVKPVENSGAGALTSLSKKQILNLLYALPHGVLHLSQEIPGLVETSTNLAILDTKEKEITIGQSSRSSVGSALAAARKKIKATAELANATVNQPDGYPGWTPNIDSEILKISKEAYKACFNKDAQVAAIHAGLECGIIGEKFPGMDMVSFGPDLRNPHSPDEKVNIESVERFWKHLVKILEMTA